MTDDYGSQDDAFAQLVEDRLADRGEQRNLREERDNENYPLHLGGDDK